MDEGTWARIPDFSRPEAQVGGERIAADTTIASPGRQEF